MNVVNTPRPLFIRCVLTLWIAALAILVGVYSYLLLQWPMLRDAQFLHYIAYLVNEHHFVLYQDIVETSWFGTFLFHMCIGKFFGYTSFAFRLADCVWLALLIIITVQVLRKLDNWLAWIGSLSAALAYLHYGPANTLQRDYILLLPIMLALLISMHTPWSGNMRAFLIGMCFGAAASIKPHAIIGFPVVLFLLRSQLSDKPCWLALISYFFLGASSLFALGLLWLTYCGGLAGFLDITLHYLPLYQELDGGNSIPSSETRWKDALHWWRYFLWTWPYVILIAATYAFFNTHTKSLQRALIFSLVALALCYNIYPLLAGKFWDYHWIPYTYFSVLATSCLLLPPKSYSFSRVIISFFTGIIFLYVMYGQYLPGRGIDDQIRRHPNISINQTQHEKIAQFIHQHLQPGEKIQAIDEGGLTPLYLLKAQAVLATPYLSSIMFLHHINSPYVMHAQRDFLHRLTTNPPKLFFVMADFAKPSGANTLQEVPGIKQLLQQSYEKIWETPSFTFWQYKNLPTTAESQPAHPAAPDSVAPSPP